MKKTLFILCLFIIGVSSFAQDLSKDDITGEWKVNQIVQSPNDIQFQALSDGFKNATFSFHEDGKFNITTSFNTPMFKIFTKKSNNANWIFEENNQHIKIGNKQNQYSIMGIIVKNKNNKILFHLDETELIMEMSKQ
ncbi:lipocalin family protein [Wenyingzhuangia marina]|uniref:Lipocalin-like domain-containing protein n=1 Tax=Wenyingzhuangia marina TaxID=1195760 RepID=A0A1M5WGM0_9FLAO|nr:lipocalin family protein [Wenyingzhuangia marina]GGF81043.1 hypothetical protein GCM10011397_25060 [Wenyingzhuangia marina]SHH86600.1 Lipocalin-like domain-containing protein [Wenyingzhuangia marina]